MKRIMLIYLTGVCSRCLLGTSNPVCDDDDDGIGIVWDGGKRGSPKSLTHQIRASGARTVKDITLRADQLHEKRSCPCNGHVSPLIGPLKYPEWFRGACVVPAKPNAKCRNVHTCPDRGPLSGVLRASCSANAVGQTEPQAHLPLRRPRPQILLFEP